MSTQKHLGALAFACVLTAGCEPFAPSQLSPDAGTPPSTQPEVGPCSTGRNIAGDVNYKGTASPNASGQGLFDDPPVKLRELAFLGSVLHSNTLNELWSTDLGQAVPRLVRYAGVDLSTEPSQLKYQVGTCASARFPQISGIVAAPDGSLYVTDQQANAVVRISSPGAAGCAASVYAGTSTPSMLIPPEGLNPGDANGAGATAQFRGPTHPAIDAGGTVYLLDNGKRIRKVASDAAHTVSTLTTLPGDAFVAYTAMVYLGGRLYVTLIETTKNSVLEVDPVTGATRTIFDGKNGTWPPLEPTSIPGLSAMIHDGTNLYVAGKEYVWRLSPSGVLQHAAGTKVLEFPPRYDLTAPHPAPELLLPGYKVSLAYHQGALYFRGRAGTYDNSYITKISCP